MKVALGYALGTGGASALAPRCKGRSENAEWPTLFRGNVLIHAGKTMTRADYQACCLFCSSLPDLTLPEDFFFPTYDHLKTQCGGIVGRMRISDCVTASDSPWFCGPYGFVIEAATSEPFQRYKGALGFFEWRCADCGKIDFHTHCNECGSTKHGAAFCDSGGSDLMFCPVCHRLLYRQEIHGQVILYCGWGAVPLAGFERRRRGKLRSGSLRRPVPQDRQGDPRCRYTDRPGVSVRPVSRTWTARPTPSRVRSHADRN